MTKKDKTKQKKEKHFLPFCVLLNVGIDPNFTQKNFSSFPFWLYSEKNFIIIIIIIVIIIIITIAIEMLGK